MSRSSSPKTTAARVGIEAQLATLRELCGTVSDPQQTVERLRPFLKQTNNLIVARAADVACEMDARALLPELIAAFERFLDAPAKSDPQCWAKNALSKALHHLGCDNSALFIRGIRTHQLEATWGGQSDVAGTLRANCAHALIDCHELTHHALLLHLLELVADPDKSVRGEAMRAIAQAGGEAAALLLRLRILIGKDEEPDVFGHCFAGLLSLEGTAAVPFVARFLEDEDDRSSEAAVALGETRTPEAFAALLACLQRSSASHEFVPGRLRKLTGILEPAFAAVLLSSIALTRQAEAVETLLKLVENESTYAEDAIEALANAGFGEEVQRRLVALVQRIDNARINRCYQRHFPQ